VVLTGSLLLEEGHFPIPQTGASAMDGELAEFEANLPAPGEEARQPFYEGLRINGLRVMAGSDLWFSMADARAELTGTLIVNKSGDALRVTGDLTGQRGTYVLRAGPILRRFEVTRASIRFLGGDDLNPAVDISARRRVIDQDGNPFDIEVRIGGTLESPTLALASESAAPIPQSELLSFLLFGQPSFALSGTSFPGGDVLPEAVFGGVSELVSLQLEQTLIDQLGTSPDIFQIRLGGRGLDESFSPSVIVGEEISPNLFLTVEAAVRSLFGSAQTSTKTFAVHLEWRITDVTTLRGSYEPINETALLRGYNAGLPTEVKYQRTIELRRRWTW
jgi:autotransporter translocation and assembly factor TamB